MTDKQFNELKKLLEAVQTNVKSIDKNVLKTFNMANQTSMYVGADEGSTSASDMLPRILEAVTKK